MDAAYRYWFLTSTTYGTWLPGDARGFVSRFPQADGEFESHNQIDTPYDKDDPDWKAACQTRLKCEPVYLSKDQAAAVINQFLETADVRGWTLYIASVMCNHFHALISGPADTRASRILGDLKAYSSRRLSKRHCKPASESWWTESGSRRPVNNEPAFREVYEYILNQPHCLAQWKRELDNTVIIPRDGNR